MIDFHTHILPGIDDGSKDIQMTHDMLEFERLMGVDLVIATPHFYASRNRIDQFLKRRAESFDRVKDLKNKFPNLPEIKLGAEVYYFTGIGRAEQIKELTVEGTDILLLELPFRPWERALIDDITDLKRRQHLRVILAHVERYKDMQKDKGLYEEVLDQADIIQMNAGSFIEAGILKRRSLFKTVNSGRKLIIGSDCHNTTTRHPNLTDGLEIIKNKLGDDKVAEMNETAEGLLK